MEKSRRDRADLIIDALSMQILDDLSALDSESCHPGSSPDDSDDLMRDLKARIIALRQVRLDVEHIFSGISVSTAKTP